MIVGNNPIGSGMTTSKAGLGLPLLPWGPRRGMCLCLRNGCVSSVQCSADCCGPRAQARASCRCIPTPVPMPPSAPGASLSIVPLQVLSDAFYITVQHTWDNCLDGITDVDLFGLLQIVRNPIVTYLNSVSDPQQFSRAVQQIYKTATGQVSILF